MEFAQNLQKLMDQKGLTNYQLAKDLDIHPTTVSNWLSGKIPRKKTQLILAEYFKISPDELVGKPSTAENKISAIENDSGYELDEVYFSIAKDAQDNKIDPEDMKDAMRLLKEIKKRREG